MIAAIRVEALKLGRSQVGVIATAALVGGMLALLGGITAGVAGGDPALIAQAGAAASLTWDGLLSGAAQIAAVAAVLGCGVVLAWLFGREFVEGTITGLFALPIGRGMIAAAKLAVYAAWVVAVGVLVASGVLVLGLVLGYGVPTGAVVAGLARLVVLVVLSGVVATPVAWLATAARSLLAGVGLTIALVVLAQVGALAGLGAWLPMAAPALWALGGGAAVSPAQLALAAAFGAAFGAAACAAWARLQLTR